MIDIESSMSETLDENEPGLQKNNDNGEIKIDSIMANLKNNIVKRPK